ncbi:hypothetical protein AB4Z46_24135 [Variovorax sp. M-6]|uniref:hypothetical protein n=1 Tax=Variovorax sp. M-6 TaxID=3233041 RepID=UPI003F95DAB7
MRASDVLSGMVGFLLRGTGSSGSGMLLIASHALDRSSPREVRYTQISGVLLRKTRPMGGAFGSTMRQS